MFARGAYMGDDLPIDSHLLVFLQELCSNAVFSKEAVVSTICYPYVSGQPPPAVFGNG